MLENGEINLASLIKPSERSSSGPTEKASEQNSTLPIALDLILVEDGRINFQDQSIALKSGHAYSAAITDLNIKGSDLGWPVMEGAVAVSGILNDKSTFSLTTDIGLPAMKVAGQVNVDNLGLSQIQPYLTPAVYAQLVSGQLSTRVDFSWSNDNGLLLKSTVNITDLKVIDARNLSDLVGWQQLTLSEIQFSQSDNSLGIDAISLIKPALTLAIDENLQVNLAGLAKNTEKTPAPAPASDSNPLTFAINNIHIQDGAVDFADHSFRPGFSAPISRLNGEISGISSTRKPPAAFTVKGQIDRYSPVTIKGQVDISAPLENSQFKLNFNRVELTTLTPYSGRFAGYSIHKGRMNLGLNYQLNDNKLTARNSMLLENLTLGDKVNSDEAIDLPIKLAIALLKDRDGRIDIELPVSGDLDNPQFKLGPVIRMALVNMLTNIVSAPFDFLASLVGGDANEMQSIAFARGVDRISGQQSKALDSLAKALQSRPELQLEVTGSATLETVHDLCFPS